MQARAGVWASGFAGTWNANPAHGLAPGPVRAVGLGGAHNRFCLGDFIAL
jgi:hypothetical protein